MPELPQIDGQPFFIQAPRGLVGLSGESRLSDGNLSYFHGQAVAPPVPGNPFNHPSGNAIRPAPPPDLGRATPPHRPDVPCEIQEPPNLNAPGGPDLGLRQPVEPARVLRRGPRASWSASRTWR